MNPADELSALYEQWRRLTLDEGAAIEAGAWTQVEHYQSAKSRLQSRIVEVSQRLDGLAHEDYFRPILEQLMDLEHQNRQRVEEQRRAARRQQQELDRSSRHLRLIHESYVPHARAYWQSYS